jgi:nucleoid-associated protein YgaU
MTASASAARSFDAVWVSAPLATVIVAEQAAGAAAEAGRLAVSDQMDRLPQHRIIAGESLWRIAKRSYGTGEKWPLLYGLNRDRVRNPDVIRPGRSLRAQATSKASSSQVVAVAKAHQ